MAGLAHDASDAEDGSHPGSGIIEFFHLHRRKAFHFALQLTGNAEDAMELTQEAFLRLHREWDRRARSRDPAPWLFAVVRNLALDLLRRRSARQECGLDDLRGRRVCRSEGRHLPVGIQLSP